MPVQPVQLRALGQLPPSRGPAFTASGGPAGQAVQSLTTELERVPGIPNTKGGAIFHLSPYLAAKPQLSVNRKTVREG